MKLLIAIPTKSAPEYLDRAAACEATWLKDCPVDYAFFRDTSLNRYDYQRIAHTWYCGLDEKDPLVRQQRMKAMCRHALAQGYDFLFRVDSDAYVWVDRLLACGFEAHDYFGWTKDNCVNAFASVGFFLSRRAMQVVVDGRHFPSNREGDYWGDVWTGELLKEAGILLHKDERFLDGLGRQDITPDTVPPDHNYISLHPASIESQRGFYGK